MARKTAIRTDNETERRNEQREQDRRDRAAEQRATSPGGLLPTLSEWREQRDRLSEVEMLKRARSAARLEMRGAQYSPDDREDCAAEIMRRVLLETGGAMPPRESPRHTLTVYCGMARNLRDSLDRLRARDRADAERVALEHAQSPAALGADADSTPARHAAIVARSSERAAERATAAVCDLLGVERDETGRTEQDGPVWLALYQWVTGETAARVAERRSLSVKVAEKRIAQGARFLRGFYSLAELADKLTLGASATETYGMRGAEDERHVCGGSGACHVYPLDWGAVVSRPAEVLSFALVDGSRDAHGRTPIMADAAHAPHWREGTDAGRHAQRAETADAARAACRIARQNVRPKRERERAKGDAAQQLQRHADSLTRVARLHAQGKRSRSTVGARTVSDVARAVVHAA